MNSFTRATTTNTGKKILNDTKKHLLSVEKAIDTISSVVLSYVVRKRLNLEKTNDDEYNEYARISTSMLKRLMDERGYNYYYNTKKMKFETLMRDDELGRKIKIRIQTLSCTRGGITAGECVSMYKELSGNLCRDGDFQGSQNNKMANTMRGEGYIWETISAHQKKILNLKYVQMWWVKSN